MFKNARKYTVVMSTASSD